MEKSEFNALDRVLYENEVNEKLKRDLINEWSKYPAYEKFSIVSMMVGLILVLMFVLDIF